VRAGHRICRPRWATSLGLIVLVGVLVAPAPAYASGGHLPLVTASIPIIGPIVSGVGGAIGSIFSTVGGAILGAFTWTIGLATKFILTTIAALVKMLIPHSWVHKGLQIMQWIVAVPDYAGKVTSPGGGHVYGFAGINALRDVFTWLGLAIAPLTLVYATSRAMIGESDPVGIPVLRMLAVTAVIVSYPYWWAQAAALADQITNTILSVPEVSRGLYKLMEYAVDGVALGGWQLIDLALMGAIGLELIGLIFLKVVVILLGALLYATGPVTIGLVPTRAGSALARAWASAAIALLVLGIAWATLFAVGALLIGDSSTAGPLIAGNSALGSLAGGLLLAVAGLASLWLCLKAARELVGLLRLQLSGLLVLGGARGSGAAAPAAAAARTTGQSMRDFGARLGRAAAAAGGELALAAAGNPALARAGRAAGHVGRRGLVGTAALAAARTPAAVAGTPAGAVFARSRVGAVAARMARAGTASWHEPPDSHSSNGPEARVAAAAREVAGAPRANGAGGRPGRGSTRSTGTSGSSSKTNSSTRQQAGRSLGAAPSSAPPPASGGRPVAPRPSAGDSAPPIPRSARPDGRPSSAARSASGNGPPSKTGKAFRARRPRPFRTRRPPKGGGQ
jgi:hypothetical protein